MALGRFLLLNFLFSYDFHYANFQKPLHSFIFIFPLLMVIDRLCPFRLSTGYLAGFVHLFYLFLYFLIYFLTIHSVVVSWRNAEASQESTKTLQGLQWAVRLQL